MILGISIETIIYIIVTALGIVIGYVKLQLKTKTNSQDISDVMKQCDVCRANMLNKIANNAKNHEDNVLALHKLIADVKEAVNNISKLLSRITGMLDIFLKDWQRKI